MKVRPKGFVLETKAIGSYCKFLSTPSLLPLCRRRALSSQTGLRGPAVRKRQGEFLSG